MLSRGVQPIRYFRYLAFFSPLFICGSSWADLGKVQSLDPKTLPQTSNDHLYWDQSFESSKSVTRIEEAPAEFTLDRQWNLETPAGSTAFILEKNRAEIYIPISRFNQLLSLKTPPIGMKIGVLSTIQLDGQAFISGLLLPSVKWNFLNKNLWSFSISGSYGFNLSDSSYSVTDKDSPIFLELSTSRVLTHTRRLHFNLELGKNNRTYSYNTYSSTYNSDGSFTSMSTPNTTDTQYSAGRLTAAHEARFNSRHGMTLWLSFERQQSDRSQNSSYSISSDKDSSSAVLVGIGYHYWLQKFGLSIGIALGPAWESRAYSYSDSHSYSGYAPYSSNYGYTDTLIKGTISGGLSYRF